MGDMIPFERDPVEYLTEERLDHYFSTNDDGYFCRQITKRQGDVSVLVALKSAVPYSGSLTMSWRSRVANGGDGGNKMVELFLGPENLDPYSWDKYKSRQTWGVLYKNEYTHGVTVNGGAIGGSVPRGRLVGSSWTTTWLTFQVKVYNTDSVAQMVTYIVTNDEGDTVLDETFQVAPDRVLRNGQRYRFYHWAQASSNVAADTFCMGDLTLAQEESTAVSYAPHARTSDCVVENWADYEADFRSPDDVNPPDTWDDDVSTTDWTTTTVLEGGGDGDCGSYFQTYTNSALAFRSKSWIEYDGYAAVSVRFRTSNVATASNSRISMSILSLGRAIQQAANFAMEYSAGLSLASGFQAWPADSWITALLEVYRQDPPASQLSGWKVTWIADDGTTYAGPSELFDGTDTGSLLYIPNGQALAFGFDFNHLNGMTVDWGNIRLTSSTVTDALSCACT